MGRFFLRCLFVMIVAVFVFCPATALDSNSPEVNQGGATMAEAYAHYSAGNAAWSMAWGSSDIGQISQHLNQAKNDFTLCLNTANQVNDPSNTVNLALMKKVSAAYIELAYAALGMYDGADIFSAGRTQMNAGEYAAAADTLQSAGERFQNSQLLFSQATITLQGISYAGTSFGDGSAYTAAIVPILNARGAYAGEFAVYSYGWQYTALAYQANTSGNQVTFRTKAAQAMHLFGSLRTSATFGADAKSNYNILAGLLGSTPPTPEVPTVTTSPTIEQVKQVVLHTTMGDITIALFGDMSLTAGNFEKLVVSGFYSNTPFHRVIDGFMIQSGDPTGTGRGGPGYEINDEFPTSRPNRNERGTISMANAGPNTGGSQFFINLVDNAHLDNKHPVFGRVVKGMDVVDAIGKVPTDVNDRPLAPVMIISAEMA